uniref:Uncharacterized protein n=1 Tax=Strigamia maritima TaxID=126957 RepID=T1JP14_STRMM
MFPLRRNLTNLFARSTFTRGRHEIRSPLPLKKTKLMIRNDMNSNEAILKLKPKLTGNKILVAFDFDKTLIDVNSDTYVLKLLPNNGEEAEKYKKKQWIDYMQNVFDLLCTSGVKPAHLFECLGSISWTKGMPELLRDLNEMGHDLIIISDCNSVFINTFLGAKGMEECFCSIFTNPAEFDTNGCLKIKMFHQQNWCELSAVNLCKGAILDEFIQLRSGIDNKFKYKFVAYVGDGMNDYCPMLRLKSADFAFPRKDFPCHKQISKEERSQYKMKAQVVPWSDGFEIRDAIFSML